MFLGAVQYLITNNITPNWEWEFQSFNPLKEVQESPNNHKNHTQIEFTYSNIFSQNFPNGYQHVITGNSVYARYKDHPEYKFEINEEAMRYIILMHFSGKNIDSLFKIILTDIDYIKSNIFHGEAISYNEMQALTEHSMPQHLRTIMHDKQAMEFEVLRTLNLKAQGEIAKRLTILENIWSKKIQLSTIKMIEQILQSIKYYKRYHISSQYTPLNEYRSLMIYLEYIGNYGAIITETKPISHDDKVNDLVHSKKIRDSHLNDIMCYIPTGLKPAFKKNITLTGLFYDVTKKSIRILQEWQKDWDDILIQERIDRIEKLGIDNSKIKNIKYSFVKVFKHSDVALFRIHPDNVLKAYRHNYKTYKYSDFSKKTSNYKGLTPAKYSFNGYQSLQRKHNPSWEEQKNKITETLDSVFNLDILSWKMVQNTIINSKYDCTKAIASIMINKDDSSFLLTPLTELEITIYEGITRLQQQYRITVKLSQISKFNKIPEESISLLVGQLYQRYSSKKEREDIGMTFIENMFEIPFDLLIEEQKRVQHEALLMTKLLLAKERDIISSIDSQDKRRIVQEAETNGVAARIDFKILCKYAHWHHMQIDILEMLRDHAYQGKIPKYFTYSQMIHDDMVQQLLDITPDLIELFDKNESYLIEKK